MKTIIDAVNELKGDLENCENTSKYWQDLGFKFLCEAYGSSSSDDVFALTRLESEDTICSIYSFNSLVTELSNWQPTLQKAETVEVNGMAYEIGKLYSFKDIDAKDSAIGVLLMVGDSGSNLKFLADIDDSPEWFQECKELNYEIGTITPAPTKLIDGEVYLVDVEFGLCKKKRVPLIYRKSDDEFFTVGCCFSISDCTNITHLTAGK